MNQADVIRENLRLSFQLADTVADEIAAGEEVVLVTNPRKPHLPVLIKTRELVAELRHAIEAKVGTDDGPGGGFSNVATGTQDHTRTGVDFSQVVSQKEV